MRRGDGACRSRLYAEGAEREGGLPLDWTNEEKNTDGREEQGDGRVGIPLLKQVSGLDTNRAKFNISVFFSETEHDL